MNNDTMQKLLDMVCAKIDQIAQAKELNATLVRDLDVLIDIKKDILTIRAMEENGYYEDNSYSMGRGRGMYSNANGYMITPYDVPQGQFNSNMYSRNNMSYNGSDGYNSYNSYGRNGYSREGSKDEMKNHLHQMMQKAGSQEERDMVQRFMDEVDRM